MKEKVEFRKIREFGEIIGDTFLFIKQNFKPLMRAFFGLTGLFVLGGMVSSVMVQLQALEIAEGSGVAYSDNPVTMWYSVGLSYIVVILFAMCSYTAMYVSILSYISLYISKGNIAPTLQEVWVYFKYFFFRMMGNGLVMGIFTVLCFLCCILPGIYVFPAATLFYVVMILENAGFSHAFNRSFKLVKDEWWLTAATLFVAYIICYACSMLIQLPAIVVVMVTTFTQGAGTITGAYVILSSVSQHISYLFMIIPIITSTLIYFNLLERKEHLGLLNRIDGLGETKAEDHTAQEEY